MKFVQTLREKSRHLFMRQQTKHFLSPAEEQVLNREVLKLRCLHDQLSCRFAC